MGYQKYFNDFLEVVKENKVPTFNSFDGKADILGKQYLIDLTNLNFPVIPTIENVSQLDKIKNSDNYIVKLKNGADSIGMEILSNKELQESAPENKLIQPLIDFNYEVSFYYLNKEFQYALYAPDKDLRWKLEEYIPSEKDLQFAQKFINWNNINHGITRVDACRLKNDSLLLVELEDLNPFLSIDLLSIEKKEIFLINFIEAIKNVIN